jgi:hypothetical protein
MENVNIYNLQNTQYVDRTTVSNEFKQLGWSHSSCLRSLFKHKLEFITYQNRFLYKVTDVEKLLAELATVTKRKTKNNS